MKKWILLFAFLSFKAYAEENVCGTNCVYSMFENGTDENGNVTYTLVLEPSDSTKTAKIGSYARVADTESSTGHSTNAPWFQTAVTRVEVKEGITDIGAHAFEDMPSITSVELPSGLKSIGNEAFNHAELKTLTIPDSVTDIGSWAFSSNKSLTTLVLGENLQNIGANAFANNQLLKSVVIPDSVVNLSATAFGGITSYTMLLNEIYCSNAQTEQCDAAVAYMGLSSKTYEKYGDGYLFDGKFYAKFSDIGSQDYVKKRIYTVDEANKVSGKKNTFKIRYK